jgi:hypothetical protein
MLGRDLRASLCCFRFSRDFINSVLTIKGQCRLPLPTNPTRRSASPAVKPAITRTPSRNQPSPAALQAPRCRASSTANPAPPPRRIPPARPPAPQAPRIPRIARRSSSSANRPPDELFHNGQIRPLTLPPLPDLDPGSDDDEDCVGGRASSTMNPANRPPLLQLHELPARRALPQRPDPTAHPTPTPGSRPRKRRRRGLRGRPRADARSMSPLHSSSSRLKLINALVVPAPDLGPGPDATGTHGEAAPPVTASSRSSSSTSSSSSSGTSSARGSRRWVFIRDMLLHRSKSEPGSGAHAHDAPGAPAASKPERAWPFSSHLPINKKVNKLGGLNWLDDFRTGFWICNLDKKNY